MDAANWLPSVLLPVLAGFFAFFVLLAVLLTRSWPHRPAMEVPSGSRSGVGAAFLFDDDILVDATPAGRQLLSISQDSGSAWSRLTSLLEDRFPGVSTQLSDLMTRGSLSLTSADGHLQLRADWLDGLIRLRLYELEDESFGDEPALSRMAQEAMSQELSVSRCLVRHFPYPCWLESPDGQVTWANNTYLTLSNQTDLRASPLFPPAGPDRSRVALALPDGATSWFDVEPVPLRTGRLMVAVPADRTVAVETSRLDLVQTLTKTFATLTIGLAVFDKDWRLILFNPALADLTQISASRLAQRPSFDDFIDYLRDSRILPEPRDFRIWKESLYRGLRAAGQGQVTETWELPDGRTYEIQGKPISGGAIAFMVQDITGAMRLTRQFRSDLTLHQEILERLDSPLIIFNADGSLFSANASYRDLWGEEAADAAPLAQARWGDLCPEAAAWDTRDIPPGGRQYRSCLADGREVTAQAMPLPGGATKIRFQLQGQRSRPIRRLQQTVVQQTAAQHSPN